MTEGANPYQSIGVGGFGFWYRAWKFHIGCFIHLDLMDYPYGFHYLFIVYWLNGSTSRAPRYRNDNVTRPRHVIVTISWRSQWRNLTVSHVS